MTHTTLSTQALSLGTRLRDVSFQIRSSECIVLTGPNGAGKSSLVRALLGLEKPTSGKALLDGEDVAQLSRLEVATKVGWLPQRPLVVEPRLTEELVAAARFRFRESREQSLAGARQALTQVGAAHLAGRFTDRISGGELQRVLLATLVAQETPLLLVDEPANHLDPQQQIAAYRTLAGLWSRGHGLLLITHELGLIRLLGDPSKIRVVGVSGGQIVVDDKLDSPSLFSALTDLSGVPIRPGSRAGALAIDWESLQ